MFAFTVSLTYEYAYRSAQTLLGIVLVSLFRVACHDQRKWPGWIYLLSMRSPCSCVNHCDPYRKFLLSLN
jgi:hypothetical protein